jgi:hypothetical protein
MNYSPLKDADITVMLTVANRDVLGMSLAWMRQLYVRDSFFSWGHKHATKTAMVGLCDTNWQMELLESEKERWAATQEDKVQSGLSSCC